MKNAAYWICLQTALGYASDKPKRILERFDDVADFFKAEYSEWRDLKLFTPNELDKLKSCNIKHAQGIIERCEKKGYSIITFDDDEYPKLLMRIKNPPCVLYVNGVLPDMDYEAGIAMVGTRKCSLKGEIIAATLSYRLAQAGAVVISGGALGIDMRCSQGALSGGGKSIIVLGCGLDYKYLQSVREIRDRVAENGAVITEYQPFAGATTFTFPQRNRIMAALSLGVTVVEAPIKSGALITVTYALEQGKDVYVVPGDVVSPLHAGSNRLLRDGAMPVYTPADILAEYVSDFPHKLDLREAVKEIAEDEIFTKLCEKHMSRSQEQHKDKTDGERKKRAAPVAAVIEKIRRQPHKDKLDFEADKDTLKVYGCLSDEPLSTDELIKKSKLDIDRVLTAITELELNDVILSLPGGRYVLK